MDVSPGNHILAVPVICICAGFWKMLLVCVFCLSNIKQNLCVHMALNRGWLVKQLHLLPLLHVLLRYQLPV